MEYLGHSFNRDYNTISISGCYFRCSKCSIILYDGTHIRYAFCNENLIQVHNNVQNILENITCDEYIIKKLLE